MLTPRETEVLTLMTRGYTPAMIARKLGIAYKTVFAHRCHIMAKLNLHDVQELGEYALRNGLI